jgi:acetolactate synthase regulatory subunit
MNNREPGSLAGEIALVTGGSRDVGAANSKLKKVVVVLAVEVQVVKEEAKKKVRAVP